MILLYIVVYKNNIFVITTADSHGTYKKEYLIIYASIKSMFLIPVIYLIGYRCILELVKNDFKNGLHSKNEKNLRNLYRKSIFILIRIIYDYCRGVGRHSIKCLLL